MAVLFLIASLFSTLANGAPPRQTCSVSPLDSAEQRQIVAAIAKSANSDGGTTPPRPETLEQAAMELGAECLQVAVLSWDGSHSGGIAVYRARPGSGVAVRYAAPYRGANRLMILPRGSILFVWRSGWGSGFLEEQAVVLQPFAGGWRRVHYFLATLSAAPPPYRGAAPTDAPRTVTSVFRSGGDTLFIARVDSIGDAGAPSLRTRKTLSSFVIP